jgi:hypothetical protein
VTWLLHLLDEYGITNSNCRWGVFWSGAGSDIGELAIIGAAVEFWRRHTCHVDSPRSCWRWAAHPVEGTPYRACKRHHPAVPDKVTAEHIQAAHDDVQEGAGDD